MYVVCGDGYRRIIYYYDYNYIITIVTRYGLVFSTLLVSYYALADQEKLTELMGTL